MGKTSKMKAALIMTAVWMLTCAVLQGAEHGFDDIVRAISDQFHARPVHIPFFGLVNFATFVAQPGGVKHLDLAVFENLNLDEHAARDVAEAIRSANRDWLPFVRVHNRAETVMVYMEQYRNDCRLLVVAIEASEATVVELKLNPEAMQAWLREPEKSAARRLQSRE
jgi:hypothetical protein